MRESNATASIMNNDKKCERKTARASDREQVQKNKKKGRRKRHTHKYTHIHIHTYTHAIVNHIPVFPSGKAVSPHSWGWEGMAAWR